MDAATVSNEWVGRVIDGKYTLLEWLGGSEWDDVFRTELPEAPSQKVAIKLVPASIEGSEDRFAAWTAAEAFSHPHLMSLFSVGRSQLDGNALVYAVTEYAEENLSQILPDRALSPAETREMLDPILDALSFLHTRQFVHGHVKPSNIMVIGGHLKLSVDSLSAVGSPPNPTESLTIYDPPETANHPISPSTDVWGLGVTLVEALTQHPPTWDRTANADPTVSATIPEFFAWIAQGCLRVDPERRFTVSQIKARLHPPPPASDAEVQVSEEKPGKRRVLLIVAALIVAVALIAFFQIRSHQSTSAQSTPITEPQPPAMPTPTAQSPASPPTDTGSVTRGSVIQRTSPDLLPSAIRTIHGKVSVDLRVTVDAGGNVTNATFISHGPSNYFARKALETAQSWKFKPPQVDGQAVESVWTLHFQFKQTGTEITPIQTSP